MYLQRIVVVSGVNNAERGHIVQTVPLVGNVEYTTVHNVANVDVIIVGNVLPAIVNVTVVIYVIP